jgi:DNA-binding Xre family transcriptional regulator
MTETRKKTALERALVARLKAIPKGEIAAAAQAAGLDLGQIMRLRRGEHTDIRISTLDRLATGLGESVHNMLASADAFVVDDKATGIIVATPKKRLRNQRQLDKVAKVLLAAAAVVR